MSDIELSLIQGIPSGVIVLIGVGILWFRMRDVWKDVRDIKQQCEKRLKWCINHFEPKP